MQLFGTTIDDRLQFDQHISNLPSKAAMQFNTLGAGVGWVRNCLRTKSNYFFLKIMLKFQKKLFSFYGTWSFG